MPSVDTAVVTAMQTVTGPALLSVVVPVYRVQPYLRQCLDSVLIEAGADVEAVAVDDASPDGCPEILDLYARAHPGMSVLHLPANVGLGAARNVGLDHATGEYVWFVDSDDWLPAGSVSAVLSALRADRPDVLLLDHVRVSDDDGRQAYDASSPLLRGVTGVGPLSRRPDLLGLQHAAWNKVVRTAYLRDLGLRFFPGWYEDFPFSHPLLIAGGTVGVLDRVCYYYRQRPSGAITRTVSDRHFDALEQYERLFAEVDRLGASAEPFRPALFRLMINHCLVIVGNDERVPPARRADFFRRMAVLYRRYLPAEGYPVPTGVTGLKHRVVAADAYWAYAALRTAYRLAARTRFAGSAIRSSRTPTAAAKSTGSSHRNEGRPSPAAWPAGLR